MHPELYEPYRSNCISLDAARLSVFLAPTQNTPINVSENPEPQMSHSPNSLNGLYRDYIGDYVGDCYGGS